MKGSKKPSGKPGDADTPSPMHYKAVPHPGADMKNRGDWLGRFAPTDGPGRVNPTLLKAGVPAVSWPAPKPKTAPPPTSRAGRHLTKVKSK